MIRNMTKKDIDWKTLKDSPHCIEYYGSKGSPTLHRILWI